MSRKLHSLYRQHLMKSKPVSCTRKHPDWALHVGKYPRSSTRNQLVLNVALPEVQDFIVDSVSNVLNSTNISYVKWDNNRGIHETPAPYTDHQYGTSSGKAALRVEGDLILTSSNTFRKSGLLVGTSLAYPTSAMGAHVSATPNSQSGRNKTIEFRAHVAMLGGSFGLELDPSLIKLAEKVGPIVVKGDMWRLNLPEETAALLFSAETYH
ncbi:hypothetical protein ED733_008708 [Metarhizium rileyi]|uniref:alpha-galactosidase n=1 Tax=Metarhizium rileyi (strain RCEF 4871) TaxID=1649241 RepID=A0A5C6GMS8_METRR|nr:hypothetical protein ED733_008708 [Metarhizium rileyi]